MLSVERSCERSSCTRFVSLFSSLKVSDCLLYEYMKARVVIKAVCTARFKQILPSFSSMIQKRNSLNSRECQLQNYENINKTIVRDTAHLNSLTE